MTLFHIPQLRDLCLPVLRESLCPHHRAPHGFRPCANVRRVGASTRGPRSLRNNKLDDAAKEQLKSAAGERIKLIL